MGVLFKPLHAEYFSTDEVFAVLVGWRRPLDGAKARVVQPECLRNAMAACSASEWRTKNDI
jgi:hypothetical protein